MTVRRCQQFARALLAIVPVSALLACAGTSRMPAQFGPGSSVILPPPDHKLIPTLKIAPAKGWPAGRMPTPAGGFTVTAYATDLNHPRWLYVLPNGDVLVAESNAPQRPEDGRGIRGWVQRKFMKRAGGGVPSANRITLLRGVSNNGTAVTRTIFLQGLSSPFGMALSGSNLYVANTDSLLRFTYHDGATQLSEPGAKVIDLPAGSINHHWTKNVIASRDGTRLYVTIGSNSNAAENGLAVEQDRARIIEVDPATGRSRPFATGLRNPNGMDWDPQSGAQWLQGDLCSVFERSARGVAGGFSDRVPHRLGRCARSSRWRGSRSLRRAARSR